jgi:hypothetical protein
MTDPNEARDPANEQQSASADEVKDLDQVDVDPDAADKVKGGSLEDPCAGGRVTKRAF